MTEVILAAVSMNVVHDKAANLEKYLQFIEEAAFHGARLLVFPEVSLQGYLKKRGAPGAEGVVDVFRFKNLLRDRRPGTYGALIQA